MRVSGREVTYRGRDYRVRFGAAEWVAVAYDGPGAGDPAYPDAVAYQPGERPGWVKLRRDALDRDVQVKVTASWHGQRVHVMKDLDDGSVAILFIGSPTFAEEHGLTGDQQNGWGGEVAEPELDDVRVEEKELSR